MCARTARVRVKVRLYRRFSIKNFPGGIGPPREGYLDLPQYDHYEHSNIASLTEGLRLCPRLWIWIVIIKKSAVPLNFGDAYTGVGPSPFFLRDRSLPGHSPRGQSQQSTAITACLWFSAFSNINTVKVPGGWEPECLKYGKTIWRSPALPMHVLIPCIIVLFSNESVLNATGVANRGQKYPSARNRGGMGEISLPRSSSAYPTFDTVLLARGRCGDSTHFRILSSRF